MTCQRLQLKVDRRDLLISIRKGSFQRAPIQGVTWLPSPWQRLRCFLVQRSPLWRESLSCLRRRLLLSFHRKDGGRGWCSGCVFVCVSACVVFPSYPETRSLIKTCIAGCFVKATLLGDMEQAGQTYIPLHSHLCSWGCGAAVVLLPKCCLAADAKSLWGFRLCR